MGSGLDECACGRWRARLDRLRHPHRPHRRPPRRGRHTAQASTADRRRNWRRSARAARPQISQAKLPVLPLSQISLRSLRKLDCERDGRISARSSGLSSISGSMRCCDRRLARSPQTSLRSLRKRNCLRLNAEERTRCLMDTVADPVVAGLGRADLRRLHEHDPPGRTAGRERIHDAAHVGRPVGAIAARLGRGARGQKAITIRPGRNRQSRIGRKATAPGGDDLRTSVEALIEACAGVLGRFR